VGERMDLPSTRKIIDAILDGTLDHLEYEQIPYFNLWIPKEVPGCDKGITNPRNSWQDPADWDEAAKKLAKKFIDNFVSFTDNEEGKRLVAAGPQI